MKPPTRRRPLVLAAAVVATYLVVAAVTLGGGTRVRPLFDGFAPPPPYRWVNPPKEFAAGNVKPTPLAIDLPLGAGGTDIRGVATDDGQFVLNLAKGAIAPHQADTSVKVEVTPLDPAKLGPLPQAMQPDGNAYQVSMAYQPSGQPVGPLTMAGNVVMTLPDASQVLLYSPDGRAWTRLSTHNLAGPVTPDTTLDQPGYFVGGAPAAAAQSTSGSSGTGDRVVAVAVITVVLALGLWALPAVVRRARRH